MIQNFVEDYESPIPIVRFYFRRIMSVSCNMLDIQKGSVILDFGCGRQYFKKYLKNKNLDFKVVGYDTIPELTDIGDYREVDAVLIFCNHVLEHLDVVELRGALDNFKSMKAKFILTGIPTENMISRVCAFIGKPHGYFEHKTKIKLIHDELKKRFVLIKRKNIMSLTIVSKWLV